MVTDTDVSALCLEVSRVATLPSGRRKIETNNEEHENSAGWTPMLLLAGATCCLGSALPAGFNIGVMNNPAHLMQDFCNQSFEQRYNVHLTKEELNVVWSMIVSIFLIGGVTGSLVASWIADRLGRRGALGIGNILAIIGAICFLVVRSLNSVELLLVGRLFVGFSGGFATSLLPVYLTEVAPLKQRGAVGVLCQLGICCGVSLGQITSLGTVLGTEKSWHIMLASFAPICIFALLVTFFLPESPKYLYVVKKQETKALKELSRLRNMETVLLRSEVALLREESLIEAAVDPWTIQRVTRDPTLKLPLILVCALQFGQQLSGINAVFYYSSSIFKNAGLDIAGAQYATLGTGVVNIGMALVAVPLMSVFGRRTLFLTSCYTSSACLVVLCTSIVLINSTPFMPWLCIATVLIYVLLYGIGLGPIPYFIGSELFDIGPRPIATSLGSVFNWGGNFLVGMTFPSLQNFVGPYAFLLFSGIVLLLALFSRTYLPETRGRNTNDIASTMTKGLKSRPNEN
ncbi:solute carrier family 2, facilitated glucose transporter member 1 isoform X2 [Orussus abietinus]|uniref:solute carrier family 2, facilitated glucose transporter member 1 isoform X2 n=1 Tax=Orussus abietinus TaxID=222816 RepID=UPI0006255C9C|nr:solute carrier family 2, facilitated glucose transporter member 1 isoform X2 [Orussus abietinus]